MDMEKQITHTFSFMTSIHLNNLNLEIDINNDELLVIIRNIRREKS
jgi:hypothetical protein